MREYHLAIVGGGPRCTYALERITALFLKKGVPDKCKLSIFERTGEFGAGSVHSCSQPPSSLLNRTVGQITFSADESNLDKSLLLDKPVRPTFYEWCHLKYKETSDEKFNLSPNDHPPRYLHGLALKDRFNFYMNLLKTLDGVEINLFSQTVMDISYVQNELFQIHTDDLSFKDFWVNEILLVTGHSSNKSVKFSELEDRGKYISYAYPLEEKLTYQVVPPKSVVAIDGLGLTVIDIILYLTEGRGGLFKQMNKKGVLENYQYIKSGKEPDKIIAFSPSGMFVYCRAVNAKDDENKKKQHVGAFFSEKAIQKLRKNFGVIAVLSNKKTQYQLDFDKHILPLIILEMAYVYYKTLLGESFGEYIKNKVTETYFNFVHIEELSIGDLLKPFDNCFDQAALFIKLFLDGRDIPEYLKIFEEMKIFSKFDETLYNESFSGNHFIEPSLWGHSLNIFEHKFCWEKIFNPLSMVACEPDTNWNKFLIDFIEKDLKFSLQNNLLNPVKACCDSVWRDLRSLITKAVDNGGLLPESNKKFHLFYVRCHNRLSNGAGIEPMKKILALIKVGLLDVSIGPDPHVKPLLENAMIQIIAKETKVAFEANILIEGKLHPFNPDQDIIPLYANLLKRKIVEKWRNGSKDTDSYYIPGSLDLDESFHPIQSNGFIEKKLTVIGPATEGMLFLQQSAARPYNNSDVLNDIANWANQFYLNFTQPPAS